MSAEADLQNLRLVNHVFQDEATKQFRKVHNPILLQEESRVEQLLSLTNNRETLRLKPFPFAAFEVNVELSREILESFGMTIGPHITRYAFETRSAWLRYKTPLEIGGKVASLLSHSTKLTDLHLYTVQDICVTEEDCSRIPLTFPHLKIFGISSANTNNTVAPVNVFPLIDLVVSRARHLELSRVRMSTRVLQLLTKNRSNNHPDFSLADRFTVNANSISLVQELANLKLKFMKISMIIASTNEVEAQRIVETVGTWLETQRSCLTDLSVSLDLPQTTTFRFPVLRVLKNLSTDVVRDLPSPPIRPYETNQFPALQKLKLDLYRNMGEIFGTCSLPSVKELHLNSHRNPLANSSLHVTFPNLTSFRLELDTEYQVDLHAALAYTLTHLTSLVDLDFRLNYSGYFRPEPSYWNILTGGQVPQPVLQDRWTDLEMAREFIDSQGPVNGIYRLPSLRNMSALQKLRWYPCRSSTLDAILYMSRAGHLIPLQKLVVSGIMESRPDLIIKYEVLEEYRKELSKYHAEVLFTV